MTSTLLRTPLLSCLGAALLAVTACSGATTSPDAGHKDAGSGNNNGNDAGNNNDGNDAGNNNPGDGGTSGSSIGGPCAQNSDCASDFCIPSPAPGYCSLDCTAASVTCPTGSTCEQISNTQSICLQNCTTSADCSTGDSCSTQAPVCVPGCSQDSDCSSTASTPVCDTSTATCVVCMAGDGTCPTGQACDTNSADTTYETCVAATDGGVISPVMDGGTTPVMDGGVTPVMDGGTSPVMDAGTTVTPIPMPGTNTIGAACTTTRSHGQTTTNCTGGPDPLCETTQDGFPGGFCTSDQCTQDSDCGTDNICETGAFQDGTGANVPFCLHSCAEQSDCRTGYDCVELNNQAFCWPACTSDALCATPGATCDTSTGYCNDVTPVGGSTPPPVMDGGTTPVMDGGTTPMMDGGTMPPPNTDGGLVTIPLTGCAFVGYNVPAKFGGSTTLTVSVDTGSTDLAVATTSCGDCGVSPELSTSGLTSLGTTSATYGSGSWNGNEYSESVQVGAEMPAVTMEFAGMTSQNGFFINQMCDGSNGSPSQGIMGMGPLDLSDIGNSASDAYFTELVAQAGIPSVFTVQLCSSGGNMWFGGYDPGYATGAPQYTPMVTSGTAAQYYSVDITSATLGSTSLGTWGDAVVDTGTWGLLMPSAAYNTFTTSIDGNAGATSIFGSGKLSASFWSNGDCISPTNTSTTRADIDAALPTLDITLPAVGGGSFTLNLPATGSYLVMQGTGSSAQYCAGVSTDQGIGFIIFGAAAQESLVTIFDTGNKRIGFMTGSSCE